ncbi:MAG: hypothetical protein R6V25_14690 [Desulfatiglandales bacterium]
MRYRGITRSILILPAVCTVLLLSGGAALAACVEPTMGDYTAYPIFQANTVAPNIMLVVDNSGSMNEPAYPAEYDHGTKYFGYFEPYQRYTYTGSDFIRDGAGDWDGNFLNWATMRRVDVMRKVLMGGLATSRTGGGNQTNIGEPADKVYDYTQYFGQKTGVTDVPASVSPCPENKYFMINMSGGDFEFKCSDDGTTWYDVDQSSYRIRVKKDASLPDEEANFLDGNLAGIMQRLWSQARFGLTIFNQGDDSKSSQNGGLIPRVIGSSTTDMINNIQNESCDTWTPLAETYYTVIKYGSSGIRVLEPTGRNVWHLYGAAEGAFQRGSLGVERARTKSAWMRCEKG